MLMCRLKKVLQSFGSFERAQARDELKKLLLALSWTRQFEAAEMLKTLYGELNRPASEFEQLGDYEPGSPEKKQPTVQLHRQSKRISKLLGLTQDESGQG